MTDKEIADTVEGWNWNLSIFEIYDEVKDMGGYGYGGGDTSEGSDLSRLLNHAYYYFNEDKIKKVVIDGVSVGETPMIKELASFLGVDIREKEDSTVEA